MDAAAFAGDAVLAPLSGGTLQLVDAHDLAAERASAAFAPGQDRRFSFGFGQGPAFHR
jgi:hypothetical protein